MTYSFDKKRSRPTYVLKSTLKDMEEKSDLSRPFLFGREIIKGARWGPNILKFSGEFTYLPLYWEWTEEVIACYSERLQRAYLYDAVYASLYSYDHDTNVLRAFCESWCPKTNTLHMEAGEGSLSLWDLAKLGGLSVSGRPYDEAIPNLAALNGRDKNDKRLIPRAFGHLLSVYCLLKDQYTSAEGISAVQWIQFWYRRETRHGPPPKRRSKDAKTRSKNTYNPSGEISFTSLDWTAKELEIFTQLQITDSSERKDVYLAAYLSCWLCVFALPEHESRLIRPETFEIAARMAGGARISMAVPVLASIYHGLTKLVTARKPAVSDSIFPAHYLYGWLAHYFSTHHDLPGALLGPRMVQCSGYGGAKYFKAVEARELIHSGASFRAASILLARNKCSAVCDDNKTDLLTFGYIISLRTAYLPLRSGTRFYLEPYNPTRFARQYGFYQEVPGVLPHFLSDSSHSYDAALKHLKTLLWRGSQSRVTLPGYLTNWAEFASPAFISWWRAVTVTDLREKVDILASSVKKATVDAPPQKEVVVQLGKRARDDLDDGDGIEVNNHLLLGVNKKRQEHDALLGMSCNSPEPAVEAVPQSLDLEKNISEVPSSELAMSSFGSSESTPVACIRTSVPGDEEDGADICISSSPQRQSAQGNDDLARSMADMVKDRWLKTLRDTTLDQVEDFVAGADIFYEGIRNFGGDVSILRAEVDAYVSHVRAFLTARKNDGTDADSVGHSIVRVERDLKSFQATLEDVRLDVRNRENQLSSIVEKRAKLEASLQALNDEEVHLKRQQNQQLEEISSLEPKVRTLEQQHEDLKVSESKVRRLREMERELDLMRKSLGAAP